MRFRLDLLRRHRLGLPDIQKVIREMGPEPGAKEFLDALRTRYQVIILSDTFYEFAMPLMAQLGMPTLFCHRLETDASGFVVNYRLRMPDQKRASVRALKGLAYQVIAAGDSYNDTAMLGEAHAGILFRPPQNVIDEFPQYPVVRDYRGLAAEIDAAARRISSALDDASRFALAQLRTPRGRSRAGRARCTAAGSSGATRPGSRSRRREGDPPRAPPRRAAAPGCPPPPRAP